MSERNCKRLNRYSIRKLTVGAASVLIGTTLFLGAQNAVVHAETVPNANDSTPKTTEDSNKATETNNAGSKQDTNESQVVANDKNVNPSVGQAGEKSSTNEEVKESGPKGQTDASTNKANGTEQTSNAQDDATKFASSDTQAGKTKSAQPKVKSTGSVGKGNGTSENASGKNEEQPASQKSDAAKNDASAGTTQGKTNEQQSQSTAKDAVNADNKSTSTQDLEQRVNNVLHDYAKLKTITETVHTSVPATSKTAAHTDTDTYQAGFGIFQYYQNRKEADGSTHRVLVANYFVKGEDGKFKFLVHKEADFADNAEEILNEVNGWLPEFDNAQYTFDSQTINQIKGYDSYYAIGNGKPIPATAIPSWTITRNTPNCEIYVTYQPAQYETITDTENVSRDIYTKLSGQPATKVTTQNITLHRTGQKDKATGEITWNSWTPAQMPTYTAPTIPNCDVSNPNAGVAITVDGSKTKLADVVFDYGINLHDVLGQYNKTVTETVHTYYPDAKEPQVDKYPVIFKTIIQYESLADSNDSTSRRAKVIYYATYSPNGGVQQNKILDVRITSLSTDINTFTSEVKNIESGFSKDQYIISNLPIKRKDGYTSYYAIGNKDGEKTKATEIPSWTVNRNTADRDVYVTYTKPITPGKPNKPGQSSQGSQASQPTKPATPGKPGQGGQSSQGSQASQPTKPATPSKPGQGSQGSQVSQPTKPATPSKPGQSNQSGQTSQTTSAQPTTPVTPAPVHPEVTPTPVQPTSAPEPANSTPAQQPTSTNNVETVRPHAQQVASPVKKTAKNQTKTVAPKSENIKKNASVAKNVAPKSEIVKNNAPRKALAPSELRNAKARVNKPEIEQTSSKKISVKKLVAEQAKAALPQTGEKQDDVAAIGLAGAAAALAMLGLAGDRRRN